MAQGHDWSKPPFSKQVYYWPFWKTFLVLLVLFTLLFGGFIVFMLGPAFIDWILATVVSYLSMILVATLVCTVIYHKYARVELTPLEVTTMNDICVRQTIQLSRISSVHKPWYGMNLLVLLKQEGVMCRLWIPLYMVGWDDFAHAVRQVTPPDNPLHQFIAAYKTK